MHKTLKDLEAWATCANPYQRRTRMPRAGLTQVNYCVAAR